MFPWPIASNGYCVLSPLCSLPLNSFLPPLSVLGFLSVFMHFITGIWTSERTVLHGFSIVWKTQITTLTPAWPTDIYRPAHQCLPPVINWRLFRKCEQLQYCPEANIIKQPNPGRMKMSKIMLAEAKYKWFIKNHPYSFVRLISKI